MFQSKPLMNLALIVALLIALSQTMGDAFGLDIRALLLVLSGCLITVLIRYGVSGVAEAIRSTKKLNETFEAASEIASRSQSLAEKTHRNGITAIEDHEDTNPLLQKGLDLAMAGHEPEEVNKELSSEMNLDLASTQKGCLVFRTLGESAPIFGLLGTLAGYVLLLQNYGSPENYGAPVATMVMSTIYGILIAYLLALPIADLLEEKCRDKEESFEAILSGIDGIQRGQKSTPLSPKNEASS